MDGTVCSWDLSGEFIFTFVWAIRLTSCFVYRLTETYWSNLQKSQSDRPIARLKLAACADAALVWDGTRGFALTDEERDVVSTVVSPEKLSLIHI